MKISYLFLAFVLLSSVAFCEQKVVKVECRDGKAQTSQLEDHLKQGWKVVTATPVQDSDSMSLGKPKQGYTASIIYIIEKN